MWGPAFAAMITTRFIAGGNPLLSLTPHLFKSKRMLLLAWLLPPLLAVLAGILTWVLRVAQPTVPYATLSETLTELPADRVATLPKLIAIATIVIMLTFGTLINVPLTLGEELGWRGFLLPTLEPRGQWPAILISNVIWGLWHAPMIVQGHAYASQSTVVAVLLMMLYCLLVGTILSWLYFRTRTPWIPGLAHAAVNATGNLPAMFFPGIDQTVGGYLNSLTGFLGLAGFIGWLILSKRLSVRAKPSSMSEAAAPTDPPAQEQRSQIALQPLKRSAMIQTLNLTRYYGTFPAVQNLELTVEPGELFGFLGPNGAGKTTTIRMLVGLLRPTSGTAIVAGHDVQKEALAAKRAIGYLAQTPLLYNKLTGREFLRFIGGLYGLTDETIAARMEQLLALVGLTDKADQQIASYSGGMRHKIGLCGALIHEPPVLILDEPLTGLDPYSARRIKDLLRELCQQGRTVFMSTHVLEIAERVCDRVGILDHGQLIAVGTIDALRTQAKSDAETTLEELFLQLTGGDAVAEVATMLEEA
jgi:ABC-2 type transport system ATP-binding protein